MKYAADPEKYGHLKHPDPPEGFSYRDIWYDLSPMRPDEFGRQAAAKWEKAEQIRAAFEKGKRLERARKQHQAESKKRSDDTIEKLMQRV